MRQTQSLPAHVADTSLHSSGQELGYVEDVSGTPLALTTTPGNSTGLSMVVPNQARPVWLEGEVLVDVTTAPAASGTGNVTVQIKTSGGTIVASGTFPFESGSGTAGLGTCRVKYRVPPNTAQDTYTLWALRGGDSTFRASLVNGFSGPASRSYLSGEYR